MLNSKALSALLSKNSDTKLCHRWCLMTPGGTLLAYTHPTDIKDLRRQAAKISLLWQDHADEQPGIDAADGKQPMPKLLRTLTVESETGNVIIRSLQPQILLVLEGGVPPRRSTFEPRTTLEGPGDVPYPSQGPQSTDNLISSSASSAAGSSTSSVSHGVLGMQRKRLDSLAAVIDRSFEQTGFRMPEEGSPKVF